MSFNYLIELALGNVSELGIDEAPHVVGPYELLDSETILGSYVDLGVILIGMLFEMEQIFEVF